MHKLNTAFRVLLRYLLDKDMYAYSQSYPNFLLHPRNIQHVQANQVADQLIHAAKTIRTQQPSSFKTEGKLVTLLKQGQAIIVGDIHGDLNSLNQILRETRFIERIINGEKLYLIFLGDYIDRGPEQLEVLTKISKLLVEYPSSVILLRGNHEGPKDVIATPHDFPFELRRKMGDDYSMVYSSFRKLVNELYTAAIIPETAFLAHGGIPTNTTQRKNIATAHITHPEELTLVEILWNDPGSGIGKSPSFRGVGHYFGSDFVEKFLQEFNLDWLIRGHESAPEGYRLEGKVLTLFSCKLPHYSNKKAAYLEIPLNKKIHNLRNFIHQF